MSKYFYALYLPVFLLFFSGELAGADTEKLSDEAILCEEVFEPEEQLFVDMSDEDFDLDQVIRSLDLDNLAEQPPRNMTLREHVSLYAKAIKNGVAWTVIKRHLRDEKHLYLSGVAVVTVVGLLWWFLCRSKIDTQ